MTLLDQGRSPAEGATGASFAWIGDRGGDWPGGARDLRGSVPADHRRLEGELPGVAVRWTGSLTWADAQAGHDSPLGPGRYRVGGSTSPRWSPICETLPSGPSTPPATEASIRRR